MLSKAEQAPAEVAIRGVRDLRYQEVVERADRLAAQIGKVTDPGAIVALSADGPVAGAIATLACGKSGCAILPLSTDSPPAYRESIVQDARPAVDVRESPDGEFSVRPTGHRVARDLRDVAYVMYTSGSTGRPKGVLVPHVALLDRLAGLAGVPGLRAGESIMAMTALSFDISMAELLLPLTVGGRLIAAPARTRLNPGSFGRLVDEYRPDVIQATPSFWRLVLALDWSGSPVSRLWCGGESLTSSLARNLLSAGKEVWNLYGPTEATIWATAERVLSPENISLGKPLAGTGLCLAGMASEGEILLYGTGLALGYLDRDEITRDRFREAETPDGPRLCYYTGDRARYRPDGSLEFLGRTDSQIKLHGHRVELGEVEAALERCPGVSEAAVVLRDADDPDRVHLAAFVVAEPGIVTRDVRRSLADLLPASMRPTRISIEAALPRTVAGKVDRVRLAGRGVNFPA
ncbi:amino acid adenylation domain-containing protein [Dactylosporangium roseum]|uniref:amino acid adenylation domain-containing protein n=1 Tax=Dactylosporangium roseum TaxID=47989 RepID=UPI0021B2E3FF|nr:amino acid adenylation domain-containing protein [Dactylosporangium roseum]